MKKRQKEVLNGRGDVRERRKKKRMIKNKEMTKEDLKGRLNEREKEGKKDEINEGMKKND